MSGQVTENKLTDSICFLSNQLPLNISTAPQCPTPWNLVLPLQDTFSKCGNIFVGHRKIDSFQIHAQMRRL